MLTCQIIIKIKDYFPKTETIPFEDYICLFTYNDYEGQIPFLPDESKTIQHQIKNVSSDINYKVHILDYNDMSLIGMCEMTILYDILTQLTPPNGFIQEQQKKLLMDLKTKRKLFNTVINTGDIFLNIYAEIYLISKSNFEHKSHNKYRKTLYQERPQCFIKYNFQIKKYFPGSNKNKSLLINNTTEKQSLDDSKCDKSNFIKFPKKKDALNNINYNTFNNNSKREFKNYSSKLQQKKHNKRTIMDLLEQKKIIEKKLNIVDEDKDSKNVNSNHSENLLINKKEGYLTEQNFNFPYKMKLKNNYIINNNILKKNKSNTKMINNLLNKNDKEKYNNNRKKDDEFENNIEESTDKNPKKGFNNNNNILGSSLSNENSNNNNSQFLDDKFVYKPKNKLGKMAKAFNKKNPKNKNENDINNNNINKNIYNNLSQKENSNTNINSYINTSVLTSNSKEEEFLDIDKLILEKGAELRNDFIIQLKGKNINHHKNINSLNYKSNNQNLFNEFDDSGHNEKLDTPHTEKIQQDFFMKNELTQECIKNNCLRLIEFYSLLNSKLNKFSSKNEDIKKKSFIFKELFSYELKKNKKMINNSNLNEFIYFIFSSIYEPINEKLLQLFHKIKNDESSVYQTLFNTFIKKEEISKYKEYEIYEHQTKIFLLLTTIKNLINKYGNVSQIFNENTNKKNILKQCLKKYDLTEKEESDNEYVNLEELSNEIKIKNENIKDFNKDIVNKFKVIKEVDEEKEEEYEENSKEIEDMNNHQILKNIDLQINEEEKEENNETNINIDMNFNGDENDEINNEEIVEKKLNELNKKDNNNNDYHFQKIGKNEYLFNNKKIKANVNKNNELEIIVVETNKKYSLEDFIQLYNEEYKNNIYTKGKIDMSDEIIEEGDKIQKK